MPTPEGSPKLTWPPTKEDLQRLYVEQRLSAAKIAKISGRNAKNPKSGAFLILYHLKKYGIKRRDRIAELGRQTESMVTGWKEKHPKQEIPDMEEEKSAVLELIRNEGLSIEHLDEQTKGRVRAVMQYLHWGRGISMTDIAELIGSKTSGYVSWLFKKIEVEARDFEAARQKAILDGRMYERKPFAGTDENKAYLLGVSHGDFHVYRPFGDAVRVSTSTTHPAMVELFESLFSRYGHVDKYPRYKNDTHTYEWNIQVILDRSFEFLLDTRDQCRVWVRSKQSTILAYLAGFIDAEGNIRPHANPRTIAIVVGIWNTDIGLLEFARECLTSLGYRPMERYLQSPPGPISSGFQIERKKAYWRLLLGRFEESQSLLRRLPLRHREKVAIKEVVLSTAKGDLYEKIEDRVISLRKSFKAEARQYTKQAEDELLEQHPDLSTPRSPPVLCTLWMESWKHTDEEIHEKILKSLRGCFAAHEEFLCMDDEPCLVICKGCNSGNIVSILVHESIHHALLWLGDEPFQEQDPLDEIVPFLHERGIVEQGFEFYG